MTEETAITTPVSARDAFDIYQRVASIAKTGECFVVPNPEYGRRGQCRYCGQSVVLVGRLLVPGETCGGCGAPLVDWYDVS